MGGARRILERAGRARRRGHGLPVSAPEGRGTGFTLIETMVAVGALAFIAVGIAVIFETTGKTVSTGRSVSAYNSYAAALQERLRADIQSMTREGFLVIRHEYADASGDGTVDPTASTPPTPWPYLNHEDAVQLAPGDEHPRLRRTDELLFFAKGQFVSAREALVGGVVARAEAARIYYGQGQRRRVDPATPTNTNPYLRPEVDDNNVNSLWPPVKNYFLGARSSNNPNRYASDWTLLRHVTLLAPAQTAARPLPANPPSWLSANGNLQDSDIQVALQPAASNIFRVLSTNFPAALPGNAAVRGDRYPAFASGLLDIATTSLHEVRVVLTTAQPGSPPPANFFDPDANQGVDGSNAGVDGQFFPGLPALGGVHNWMDEALPTQSINVTMASGDYARMRCEPAPPDFLGVLKDETSSTTADRDFRRADQLMLSASNFLPRCSEFIVEWSFGRTYPVTHPQKGELIWHGLERKVMRGGGNGVEVVMAEPYDPVAFPEHTVSVSVPRRDGGKIVHGVTTQLIHGDNVAFDKPLTSYFGYFDPTFNPDLDGPAGPGTTTGGAPDGKLESDKDAAVATAPWPWPKFIRVTLSLADPGDASVERTFQFVFEVPQEGAR